MASSSEFKTILVLDDDPQFHRLVVPLLLSRGHKTLSAQSGAQASLLMAGEETVDLVIVDGQLPAQTGIDWIANLRAAGNKSLLIFVSAYWRDAQSYHKLTKELGVSLVLHKPVIPSVFAAQVDLLLGKSPGFGDGAKRDFADTLLALRAEYARELPARLAELSGLLTRLPQQPDNRFLFSEARMHAHKLRGTASSYGFKEISELAAGIEDGLVEAQSAGNGLRDNRQISEFMERALSLASREAQQACAGLPEQNFGSPVGDSSLPAAEEPALLSAIARILVVDDDAAFLDVIDDFARRHQLEVARASNAAEALDAVCMQEIDAALIDVELGSRDTAFKLASDLRSLPGYQNLPLGFVSGAGHIEDTIEVDNVGYCLLLDRSLRADALEAAVRQLMAIKQAVRPRVLVIDDDTDFLQRTAFVLAHEDMQVRTLEDTVDILEEMQRCPPDLLLLDVMMPGVSGFDICRMLRTVPRWRDLPIVFLTAFADIDTRIACLRCGGDDCLVKPVVNEELLVRLQMRLERARTLKQRLEHDNVSGLLNRRAFMEQLKGAIAEGQRHGWNITVCLMRISGLDGSSEAGGVDAALSMAGNLLSRRLRTEDIKGRWGDNTLIAAFRSEESVFVSGMLQRIAEEFAAAHLPPLSHESSQACLNPNPKMEYALACYPVDAAAVHQLLLCADQRLRQEKPVAAGKGTKGR